MKTYYGSGPAGLLTAATVAAVLIAGCNDTLTRSTDTRPSPSAPTPEAQSPTAPADRPSSLPRYLPSTVVSNAPGSLQLTSPSSVQEVTAFYDRALTQGGWSIVSSSKGAYSTNVTARKGRTGTTLSISWTGSGTYISLVTYPI